MAFLFQIYAVAVLALLPNAFRKIDAALKYVSVESADGNFKLRWTLNNDKLFFNITCKTTGWCAVGFTTTEDGRNMVNYDMAVGGVASNNTLYLDGYQSTSKGVPTKDPTPDYKIMKATEENGYTSVEFERSETTEGDDKDVQFEGDTEVWIVWAWRNNDDASSGLNGNLKHSATGISTKKYNLVKEITGKASAGGSSAVPLVVFALISCILLF